MTVGIIYRVPGLGAVLGCDSRVTADNGEIDTDHDEKWLACNAYAACCAGAIGGLWMDLRASPPRSWPELRRAVTDIDAVQSHDRDYSVLVYERRTDTIWSTDHQGDASRRGLYGAIGCGAGYALGALDAATQARTLESAARLVRRALKIACRRHSACGGRLRVLTIPRRGDMLVWDNSK